jgi:putative ABC transport system substrate-binding protein
MRRRDLLGSLTAAAALVPIGAAAQRSQPIIGYLSARSPEAETPLRNAFQEALERAGFVAGRNLVIDYRFAEGDFDRLQSFTAELVGLPAALLVATNISSAVAAKKATPTIPIVFGLSGPDPVQQGLVASLARPGGNATGITSLGLELLPKRLELLREVMPQTGLIAVLIDTRVPTALLQIQQREVDDGRVAARLPGIPVIEAAAQALGQPVFFLEGGSEDEIEKAFATMAERQVRGLLFGNSTNFQIIARRLVALAARYRIPAIYEWPEFVAAGGLMSYNANRREIGGLLGDYAGRILKGAAPADLPVVQSSRFQLVINLKTAGVLGLVVPQSLLQRADEVIE